MRIDHEEDPAPSIVEKVTDGLKFIGKKVFFCPGDNKERAILRKGFRECQSEFFDLITDFFQLFFGK